MNINNIEKVEKQMGDKFSISVPNKPEYVSIIRLTASGIASKMGFSIEDIEDIKVAISEACTNSIEHGLSNYCENFNIDFKIEENKIDIDIIDEGIGFSSSDVKEPNLNQPKEGGLGLFIIKSLMDEVEVETNKGMGTRIKMKKYLGDDI